MPGGVVRNRHWEDIALTARATDDTFNGGGKQVEKMHRFTVLSRVSAYTAGQVQVHVEVSDDDSNWYDLYEILDSGAQQIIGPAQSAAGLIAFTFECAAKYIRAVAVTSSSADLTHGVEIIGHENVG